MSMVQGILPATRAERLLEEYFDERIARALTHGERYAALWKAARDAASGGKKLRPALVMQCFAALRDDSTAVSEEAAAHVAAAFELLHTAFLLHDDVIDGDTVRRGRLNLSGAFIEDAKTRGLEARAAREWGEASAILAGDLLIQGAHTMIERSGLPQTVRNSIEDVFDETMFVTAAGEHSDVAFATGVLQPGMAEVLAMTEAKTAHYSFGDPLRAGALLAGAPEALVALLGGFGALVGAAFQVRDDVLGTFGDSGVLGKRVDGDLRTGKITALVAYAADSGSWAEFGLGASDCDSSRNRQRVGDADGDVRQARAALADSGAREFAEELIAGYLDAAHRLALSPLVCDPLRLLLEDCAKRATERVA